MKKLEIKPKTYVEDGFLRVLKPLEFFKNKEKKLLKKHPDKVFLIKFHYLNDTTEDFIIVTSDNLFNVPGVKKKDYMLVPELAKKNINSGINELTYHEGSSLPANREFVLIKGKGITEKAYKAFLSITPSNIKEFIKMKFVEKVINPIDLEKWLKLAAIAAIGAAALALINVILSSGVVSGG